jgi:cysteine desulfurase
MIYFDYNSTVPLQEKIFSKINLLNIKNLANPSSVHKAGRNSKKIIEQVRNKLKEKIKANNYSVIFTSGATESNNLAIKGFIKKNKIKKIYTFKTEHLSVLDVVNDTQVEIFFFETHASGLIDLNKVEEVLKKEQTPFLLSVMFANNETGIINPIKDISKLVKKYGGFIHSDGVQALGKIPINLDDLNLDLFSVSSHKIGGLPGTGALLLNKDINIAPELIGGGQEKSLRAGTENILGIFTFGEALENLEELIKFSGNQLKEYRDYFERKIKQISNEIKIFGEDCERLPNTSFFSHPSLSSEIQLVLLDQNGFCVSSGSACSSGKIEPSHVLKALNVEKKYLNSAIRVSLGWETTKEQVQSFIDCWSKNCISKEKLSYAR